MGALVVIAIVMLVLVAACVLGQIWGPVLLAVGFGGWGLLLLTSGLSGVAPLLGVGFVTAGVVELAAAGALFGERDPGRQRDWRLGSALLGLAGSVAALASLAWITAAMMSALFI